MPVIIFVTAYDEFALRAFEAQALDYLLKPFDDERFAQSLQRARTYLNGNETDRLESFSDSERHALREWVQT